MAMKKRNMLAEDLEYILGKNTRIFVVCYDVGLWRYSCNSILAFSFLHVLSCLRRNAMSDRLSTPILWAQSVLKG